MLFEKLFKPASTNMDVFTTAQKIDWVTHVIGAYQAAGGDTSRPDYYLILARATKLQKDENISAAQAAQILMDEFGGKKHE